LGLKSQRTEKVRKENSSIIQPLSFLLQLTDADGCFGGTDGKPLMAATRSCEVSQIHDISLIFSISLDTFEVRLMLATLSISLALFIFEANQQWPSVKR
jgi:hypothetical protein